MACMALQEALQSFHRCMVRCACAAFIHCSRIWRIHAMLNRLEERQGPVSRNRWVIQPMEAIRQGSPCCCLQELLGDSHTSSLLSDVQQEAAKCEAILQTSWGQRIGLQPLKICQDVGKAQRSVVKCIQMPAADFVFATQGSPFLLSTWLNG